MLKFINDDSKRLNTLQAESYNKVLCCLKDCNIPSFKTKLCSWQYSQFKNKCLLTKTSIKVYARFKLSRYSFRNLANLGLIYGVKKSVL